MKATLSLALVLACIAAPQMTTADGMRDRIEAAVRKAKSGESHDVEAEFKMRDFDALEVDDDKLRFRSVLRTAPQKGSAVEFHFDLNGVPRWKLRTMSRSTDSKSSSAFRTGFLRLAEYNGTIGPAASTNYLSFPGISASQWTSLKSGVSNAVTADGATVKVVTATLAIASGATVMAGLNFTVESRFTNAATVANGTALIPSGLKYSIAITNFPYKMANSRLALFQAFWQKDRRIDRGTGDSATVLQVDAGTNEFGWDASITADGMAANVTVFGDLQDDPLATAPPVDGGDDDQDEVGHAPKVIVYTFPRAAKINWDPYMLVTDAGLSSGTPSQLLQSSALFSAVVSLAVAFVV